MKRWVWLAIFLAAAGAVLLWMRAHGVFGGSQPPAQPPAPRPVPVAVVTASRGDMPVYYTGLGSVIPLYTVTVHTRVDGQLMAVYYKEGDHVQAGDLLAELDPRPFQVQLEQAESQLQHDQAILANAQVDLARYSTLVKTGAIPSQQYDTQVSTVKQAQAQVNVDQSAIANAKLQLVYCRIIAPVSGRIGLRLVDPGNIVHITDTNGLLVITQMEPATVIFALPEAELLPVARKRRAGQALRVDAMSRDMTQVYDTGKLTAVDNLINQDTGTGNLRAEFPNRGEKLFPNQFVNARVLLEMRHGQIILPSVTIQNGPQGTFVWIVKPDHTVEVRQVAVGIVQGTSTSLSGGVNAGETVVADGFDNLQPGSRVSIKPGLPPTQPTGTGIETGPGAETTQ